MTPVEKVGHSKPGQRTLLTAATALILLGCGDPAQDASVAECNQHLQATTQDLALCLAQANFEYGGNGESCAEEFKTAIARIDESYGEEIAVDEDSCSVRGNSLGVLAGLAERFFPGGASPDRPARVEVKVGIVSATDELLQRREYRPDWLFPDFDEVVATGNESGSAASGQVAQRSDYVCGEEGWCVTQVPLTSSSAICVNTQGCENAQGTIVPIDGQELFLDSVAPERIPGSTFACELEFANTILSDNVCLSGKDVLLIDYYVTVCPNS